MEFDLPFVVRVCGVLYIIRPQEDDTFNVMCSKGNLLGNIFTDIGIDAELSWSTGDLIDLRLVSAIGQAIEMTEM